MLLSVAEAERIVLETVPPLPAEDCPLASALGRVLREPILADRDLPPCDRVTLDGIAVRHAAWLAGRREFRCEAIQPAGTKQRTLADPDACLEIMTGAELPVGCDTVIPYEELVLADGVARVKTGAAPVRGQGIHQCGSDATAGGTLVPAGARVMAREIGSAAAVGCSTLRVALRPRMAVVTTGDELVAVDQQPERHQLRRSNEHALCAALQSGGGGAADRFHLRDLEHEIAAALRRLTAEYDWLVLCGGVSKGRFDFLPRVLEELHVTQHFHGVSQRPGKPFWYGTTRRATPVFALPGNPVSALICLRRYVLPALETALGAGSAPAQFVALAADIERHPTFTRFISARLASEASDARVWAWPAPTNTSGDFAGLAGSDGFAELPPGNETGTKGTIARFWRWD